MSLWQFLLKHLLANRILAVSHTKAQQELMKNLIQSKDINTLDENKVLELDSLPVIYKRLVIRKIIQRPNGNPMRQLGKKIHTNRI